MEEPPSISVEPESQRRFLEIFTTFLFYTIFICYLSNVDFICL